MYALNEALPTLINYITVISNVQTVLLLATALFLAQIMKYVQKTTDEAIDGLREKYFDNQLSRRSVYNLIWIGLFMIGYFLCPLTETASRLLFSLFFALFVGDLLSLFATINTDKSGSEIQPERDEVKNEKSSK